MCFANVKPEYMVSYPKVTVSQEHVENAYCLLKLQNNPSSQKKPQFWLI